MSPKFQHTTETEIRNSHLIYKTTSTLFYILFSEPFFPKTAPFLRGPVIQKPSETTHKIHDDDHYLPYYTPT
jgi:hypothetical protein